VCHEHHVLLENGTEEGSKASAGIRAVASANDVDVQVNFRIILKDNKVQQFDARQGTATRPDPGSTLIEG
jgi:hypothetical protein